MNDDSHKAAPEKLTLRLSPEVRAMLDAMARRRGVSLGEVIRRAIGTEKFLWEEIEKGNAVLIEEKGGRVKQLVFS